MNAGTAKEPGRLPQPPTTVSKEPVLNLMGVPIQGSPSASVVMVEFGDFDCEYCARFATGTLLLPCQIRS
jgi:protein-disulfide isomerase